MLLLEAGTDNLSIYSNLLLFELILQCSLLLTKMESFLSLMCLRSIPWSIRDLLSPSSNLSFWRSCSVMSGLMYIGASNVLLELRISSTMLERRGLTSNGLGRSLLWSYLPRRWRSFMSLERMLVFFLG